MEEFRDKKEKLAELEKDMGNDDNLPLQESNLVFGEGKADTDVLFIGEAPGVDENIQKRPFVGRAGKLLDKLIKEIGWERSEVYITNIVKRRPPGNRDPLPEEINFYKPYLTKQIRIIGPKVIVPLGRFAMNYFLPKAKISKDQGKIFWMKNKMIMPMYHPAAALRSMGVMEETKKSFRKLKQAVVKYNELLAKKSDKETKKPENKLKRLL